MDLETAKFILQIASLLFVGTGVFYAARRLRAIQNTNEINHDWNRRKAAQDMSIRLGDFVPRKSMINSELGYLMRKDPYTTEELEMKFEQNPEVRSAVHEMLNYYEFLAIGVKQAVYDEEVVKSMWGVTMAFALHKLKPYLNSWRIRLHGSEWSVMEEYVLKWEHSRRETPDRKRTS